MSSTETGGVQTTTGGGGTATGGSSNESSAMTSTTRVPPAVIFQGALRKRSVNKNAILGTHTWQTRYFVLDDSKTLSYFSLPRGSAEKPVGGFLKAQIALTADSKIQLSDLRPHGFELVTPFVTLFAQAWSDTERDVWIAALSSSIKALGAEKKSKKWQKIKKKAQEVKQGKKTGRGTHTFQATGQQFEVDVRYEYRRVIGRGAYGVVVAAHDSVTKTDVAIKKISGVFDNVIDAKRILREVTILRHLKHKNISHILDIMRPPPVEPATPDQTDDFNDVYIVLDLMDTDLHRVIYSTQQLFDQHIQYLMFQLLSACYYLQTCNIIHRDLKPSNILVNAACSLRLCDFGLARAMEDNIEDQAVTVYVVTRWYRAPELLLSYPDYTEAIDMWSVGCIFAELLGRKPLFAGDDYMKQLRLITDVLGSPSEDDISFLGDGSSARYVREMPQRPKIPWKEVPQLANASDLALDLLDKMLTFDPFKRITPAEALRHPYLQVYHNQPLEACTEPFTLEDIENKPLTKRDLRESIMREIEVYRPHDYSQTHKSDNETS